MILLLKCVPTLAIRGPLVSHLFRPLMNQDWLRISIKLYVLLTSSNWSSILMHHPDEQPLLTLVNCQCVIWTTQFIIQYITTSSRCYWSSFHTSDDPGPLLIDERNQQSASRDKGRSWAILFWYWYSTWKLAPFYLLWEAICGGGSTWAACQMFGHCVSLLNQRLG